MQSVENGVGIYECASCGNVYRLRPGESFPVYHTPRRAVPPKPPACAQKGGSAADTVHTPARPVGAGAEKAPSARNAAPDQRVAPVQKPAPARDAVPQGTAAQPSARPRRLSGDEIFSACIDSVIEVRARRGKTLFSGSAYSLGGGYAITNAHVVAEGGKPADHIELYACGETFSASIAALGSSFPEKEDLALLKLAGAPDRLKAVTFADMAEVRNGRQLYVIGNSLGSGTCITAGVVSDDRRTVEGKPRLMTDCAVNRGNSGGPVFDDCGRVVGTIVAVTTSAEGMNYAIPADIVQKFIKQCGISL